MTRAWAYRRWAVAVAVSAVAVFARLALLPLWGWTGRSFILFFPAIVIAAWHGGAGPGLFATAIGAVASAEFARERWTVATVIELVIFLAIGGVTSSLYERLRRARDREASARRRAEDSQAAREQLLAIVAHDLRNPLHAIAFNADAAERAPSADVVRKRLTAIKRAVARMDRLVEDLLDAARIEGGHLELTLRPESAQAIVDEALDAMAESFDAKGLRIETRIEAMPPIAADRGRIAQVLANVLGNAVKFTARGGRIAIGAAPEGEHVRFEVEDTGCGIAPEDLPRVFERSFTRGAGGTGLGLYLARGIVEAHGGSIEVRSKGEGGTTVRFTLPIAGAGDSPRVSSVELVAPRHSL